MPAAWRDAEGGRKGGTGRWAVMGLSPLVRCPGQGEAWRPGEGLARPQVRAWPSSQEPGRGHLGWVAKPEACDHRLACALRGGNSEEKPAREPEKLVPRWQEARRERRGLSEGSGPGASAPAPTAPAPEAEGAKFRAPASSSTGHTPAVFSLAHRKDCRSSRPDF